jgi:transmembrane sensor
MDEARWRQRRPAVSTERHKRIEEQAGDWLARRDAGEWSDADQQRFEHWLDESPLHRVAYLRLENVWERAQRLQALRPATGSNDVPSPGRWVFSPFFNRGSPEHPKLHSHGRSRFFKPLALAACFAALVASGALWHSWRAESAFRTPVGGLALVPMQDGSKVTLNTDSEIRVALTEHERRVELDHGEAFFDVAKDPRRPFVVHAGDKRVVAVGTRFSVRRDGNDIQVVVTDGKVRVETPARSFSQSAEALPAGTVAQASDSGILLQTKQLAEAEESLSWRQGVLVFRQMTLADAVAEFNRYNARKIVIADDRVGAFRVAGSFRANNVDAFVRLLERGYPLHVERRDDEVILKGR